MSVSFNGLLCVTAVVVLAGCGTSTIQPRAGTPRIDSALYRVDTSLYRIDTAMVAGLTDTLAGVITLRQAIAQSLLGNPELRTYAWEARAQEARLVQAGLYPNPELGLSIEDIAGSGIYRGFNGAQSTLQLSQVIQLGGKRHRAADAASLSRDLAAWDYEAARISVLTQVSGRYMDVLSAQGRLAFAEETVRLGEQLVEVVGERVKAGKVSPIEETKARVVLASNRIDRERARIDLDAARQRLAALWGSLQPRFHSVAGRLDTIYPLPSLETLTGRLQQHPGLMRWNAEVAQRRAIIEMERARGVPDITLSGGIRRYEATDDLGFVLGISAPIPLFSSNEGNVLEAEIRLAKVEQERQAATLQLMVLLADAYNALRRSHAEVTIIREQMLPDAQSAFEAVREGYSLGRFGLLDVLDAQRTLFLSRSQYLHGLSEYHTAVAQVESLIGGGLGGDDNSLEKK